MSAAILDKSLDVLCPMHLQLNPKGEILHAGPTLHRMLGDAVNEGRNFHSVFDISRPRNLLENGGLFEALHKKLYLRLKTEPQTSLKGIMVLLGGDAQVFLLNLSFGISIQEAVRDFALTNTDFAATDLAVEMLYLLEAKTAAMEASTHLNTRLQGAKAVAEEQAYTDTLTGLKNRRALEMTLTRLLAMQTPFAVMQIDLDRFKAVNDTLGHAAGDHVLKKVAKIMIAETRGDDVIARVGGDEFTVVLPNVYSDKILRGVGARIIEQVERPMAFRGSVCKISASIGTVWLQEASRPTMERLLSDADVALYASKNSGRAMQTLYTPELRKAENAVAPQVEK